MTKTKMTDAEVTAHNAAITRRRLEAVLGQHGLTYAQGMAMPLSDIARIKGMGRKALLAIRAERFGAARLHEARRVLTELRGHYAREAAVTAALETALLAIDNAAELP